MPPAPTRYHTLLDALQRPPDAPDVALPKAEVPTWHSKLLAALQGATGLPLTDPSNYQRGGEELDRWSAGGELATMALPAAAIVRKLLVADPEVLKAGYTATKSLSALERDALTKAGTGVRVGRLSEVDDMLTREPELAQRVYERFTPAREAMRTKYGDRVTLYRAQGPERTPGKATLNYASKAGAEQFLEPGRKLVAHDVDVNDIFAIHNPTGEYEEYVVLTKKR